MKLAWIFGIGAAILLHAAFLLFGGLLFGQHKAAGPAVQEVELVAEDVADERKPDQKEEPEETPAEELSRDEAPPDANEIIKDLEQPAATDDAPALDNVSLSAIEAALSGVSAGGGDFGETLTFRSGGRIGGTGREGSTLQEKFEDAFEMAEMDQRPRPVFQAAPTYPSEMRGKKQEALVTVIFVVDEEGKVQNARVERASHPAFEAPALSAVRKWKFEPGMRGGERVSCRMRVPIRFPVS
ncbi:MAG: energy transducer TonB [Phycisphaerae bacterium]|nr:energy transducer TonB [Phycisphaerae bacterium]